MASTEFELDVKVVKGSKGKSKPVLSNISQIISKSKKTPVKRN